MLSSFDVFHAVTVELKDVRSVAGPTLKSWSLLLHGYHFLVVASHTLGDRRNLVEVGESSVTLEAPNVGDGVLRVCPLLVNLGSNFFVAHPTLLLLRW